MLREGTKAHRSHIDQLGEAIAAAWPARAEAFLRSITTAEAPQAQGGGDDGDDADDADGSRAALEGLYHSLAKRFSKALEWLLVREVLHREVEGISCEARRHRVELWAHDCIPRPDGRGIYRPRCTRRGDSRPERAQPSEATRLAGEVAVPALSPPEGDHRMFGMERVSLASFLGCDGSG